MTGAEALAGGAARLRAAGVEAAMGDARRLLCHALKLSPERLTLALQAPLSPDAAARFESAIAARAARQPVAQITGVRQFWGREFRVTPDVLDPRPETETLIEAALEAPFARVLDLGTGSGCILLTLLAERAGASGIGIDISEAALKVARANADALGLAQRAEFRRGDWCAGLSARFDLIVSNPPYIGAQEWAGLAPELREWEPRGALCPEGDALAAYRAIAAQVPGRLTRGGRAMLEVGAGQAAAVQEMLRKAGLTRVDARADMDGRARVVLATRP